MTYIEKPSPLELILSAYEFLQSIEGDGYGGMAKFEIARAGLKHLLPVLAPKKPPTVYDRASHAFRMRAVYLSAGLIEDVLANYDLVIVKKADQ